MNAYCHQRTKHEHSVRCKRTLPQAEATAFVSRAAGSLFLSHPRCGASSFVPHGRVLSFNGLGVLQEPKVRDQTLAQRHLCANDFHSFTVLLPRNVAQ